MSSAGALPGVVRVGTLSTTSPFLVGAQGVAIVPDPPEPTNVLEGEDRYGCPHLDSGLSSWHSSSTWGGAGVPTAGSSVVLPSNKRVVVTQTIAFALGKITIPVGSELIIGENAAGIELRTTGIEVLGQLTVGSETCRIETRVTITLLGSRPANAVASPPSPAIKGIVVDGVLSLHGKRYYQTWSRLEETVVPGDTSLSLGRPVNWEPGQQIVLVTSAMHDARGHHQNEVLTVASVSDSGWGGSTVEVTEPVQYRHTANQYYQVEVGLLTRTILIQGSATDSEPTDLDPGNCLFESCGEDYHLYQVPQTCTNKELTGYGGHVQVRMAGVGYVEGVELYRMGQTNVLGRYPMHFHMLEACPTCYFRDSSVHRSYYRCISIHGTHNATISENVAYDVIGFCYYLEDGVEQYNTLSYNLAAHVHTMGPDVATGCWGQTIEPYNQSSSMILPADVTASGFYITNIRNFIVGNAASGVCIFANYEIVRTHDRASGHSNSHELSLLCAPRAGRASRSQALDGRSASTRTLTT
jgi:G8 domain